MTSKLRFVVLPVLGALALVVASSVIAAGGVAPDVSALRVPGDATEATRVAGPATYVLRLTDASLATQVKAKGQLSKAQQNAYLAELSGKQNAVSAAASSAGAKEIGRIAKALNAIVVEGGSRSQLEAIEGVASVKPLNDFELDLSETVPYIGAAAAQADGYDGDGISVAVLDSGIDYNHAALGGSGNPADFAANDPVIVEPGSFPTAKVTGGYDFVGGAWTGAPGSPPEAPDPDPLDAGPGRGHGTHVAHIIGGTGGVAPAVDLYAVKVCSSVSTSCSGLALLNGVDFALDPNNDGDVSDAVDVMNLSLGSSYGQKEDDLSFALANAVGLGVTVVASAGNSADKPYVNGSPSSTPEVIAVAQTQVPSAKLYAITAGGVTVYGSWQAWSAAPTLVSGPLAYDTTSAATRIGCTNAAGVSPWVGAPFAGKVLLVDRGTCAISMKVSNGAAAGAIAVVVANNAAQAPGDLPPDFSFGGGTPTVAGYSITRLDGLALKAVVGTATTINPASAAPIVGGMVSSSSRGPSFSYQTIKPDIGAPGASVSAEAGSGTGATAFGGTSGAAPMVAGSAALMLDARPGLTPAEVKSLMMNTANTNISINPTASPPLMAPITRVGGGEVRVDDAIDSQTGAWDADALAASLSFGYQPISGPTTVKRQVTVKNYGSSSKTYSISSAFRYADDAASGAVSVSAPSSVTVQAGGSKQFEVSLTIDPSKLPIWTLNGGSQGGNGFLLNSHEFDGYLTLDGGAKNTVHLAWHVLPHRSALVRTDRSTVPAGQSFTLRNQSNVLAGGFDVFALTGTSDVIKKKNLPQPGDNYAIIDLRSVGARPVAIGGGAFGVQFAIDTFGKRSHPNYPAGFEIDIDNDNDGDFDRCIFNAENGGFAATGQNAVAVSAVGCASTTTGSLFFFNDADLNSGNAILTAPLSALGIGLGTTFRFSVYSWDNYFTGAYTDAIENMTFTLDTPKYATSSVFGSVPAGSNAAITVAPVAGGATKSPSQSGVLVLYRDAAGNAGPDASAREAEAIRVP